MHRAPEEGRASRERTCVGCGLRADGGALLRVVVAEDEVLFDLAGGAFGRGAHVHASTACLQRAPRGLSRAFKRDVRIEPDELGRRLVAACDRRLPGLLLAAKRIGALALGADAMAAVRGGALALVAVDAGTVAGRLEIQQAVREGRALAWKTKSSLGGLLGLAEVAVIAIRHAGIAAEIHTLRVLADAGAATTTEGAGCSSTFPEAR